MADAPIIAAIIGDPCGIGPEVLVKALAAGDFGGRALLVGHTGAVEHAIGLTGAPFAINRIADAGDAKFAPGTLDVLDPGTLKESDITIGKASGACGAAVLDWLDIAGKLALNGPARAMIMTPINSEAFRLSGKRERPTLHPPGTTNLFLISGPLRIVHLTDHLPLREVVLKEIRADKILALLRKTHAALTEWGVAHPRIGVAGLNPHAHGEEDQGEIAPAVEQAVQEGIGAIGPVSPDTVFRQGIEGLYDCVLAHYHDQGHIALKSWGFSGNCALLLGAPYLHITVAHGTAFDIAGKGVADPASLRAALGLAASLAAGRGFPAA